MIRISFIYSFIGNIFPTLINCFIDNLSQFHDLPKIGSPMLCGITAGMMGSWTVYNHVIGFGDGRSRLQNDGNKNIINSFLIANASIFTGLGIICSWIVFYSIELLIR
jgi:hypothetical protein